MANTVADKVWPAINEGTTGTYGVTLKDENAVAITGNPFTSVRMSFYSIHSGAIINGRSNQNILNENNVTISSLTGKLTWKQQEADVKIVDTPKPSLATHRAEIVIEWNDSASVPRQLTRVIDWPIRALTKAPFDA